MLVQLVVSSSDHSLNVNSLPGYPPHKIFVKRTSARPSTHLSNILFADSD